MESEPDQSVANMEGEAALPRLNGELVFEEPWESRAFGVALAMNQDGLYQWREFSDRLIDEIARADKAGEDEVYYRRWLAVLETIAVEKRLISPDELEARTSEYRSEEREDDHHR